MTMSEKAKQYYEKMFENEENDLAKTDSEFFDYFNNFAFDEVVNEEGQQLDDRTRFIAILAVLIGSSSIDEFRLMMKAALRFNVTPVEIKEIIYQAVDYLGMGRTYPFLKASNEILEDIHFHYLHNLQQQSIIAMRRVNSARSISLVNTCVEMVKGVQKNQNISINGL